MIVRSSARSQEFTTLFTMAIDPICGMQVDETTALRAERDGQSYYFCCEHCRQKFLNPAPTGAPQLLTLAPSVGSVGTAAKKGAKYTCPMHPEIVRDHPGSCPKCGMALEPMEITAEVDDDGELRDM